MAAYECKIARLITSSFWKRWILVLRMVDISRKLIFNDRQIIEYANSERKIVHAQCTYMRRHRRRLLSFSSHTLLQIYSITDDVQ